MQIIKDTERFPLTANVLDVDGQPAVFDGPPSWSSSDPTIVSVTPDPTNPLSAMVSSVGPVGSATITMTGDADLGEGVTPIITTFDVQVSASDAASATLVAGAVESRL